MQILLAAACCCGTLASSPRVPERLALAWGSSSSDAASGAPPAAASPNASAAFGLTVLAVGLPGPAFPGGPPLCPPSATASSSGTAHRTDFGAFSAERLPPLPARTPARESVEEIRATLGGSTKPGGKEAAAAVAGTPACIKETQWCLICCDCKTVTVPCFYANTFRGSVPEFCVPLMSSASNPVPQCFTLPIGPTLPMHNPCPVHKGSRNTMHMYRD